MAMKPTHVLTFREVESQLKTDRLWHVFEGNNFIGSVCFLPLINEYVFAPSNRMTRLRFSVQALTELKTFIDMANEARRQEPKCN